jgi:hypothetical protein
VLTLHSAEAHILQSHGIYSNRVLRHLTATVVQTLTAQYTLSDTLQVLVDGAHALGYMPLHLPAIGADYYVANCHKWLCNARGAALLHIPSAEHRALIKPSTISHGYDDSLLSGLMWDGSRDYSAALTVPSALRFWQVLYSLVLVLFLFMQTTQQRALTPALHYIFPSLR